jgi:hypothetical protein
MSEVAENSERPGSRRRLRLSTIALIATIVAGFAFLYSPTESTNLFYGGIPTSEIGASRVSAVLRCERIRSYLTDMSMGVSLGDRVVAMRQFAIEAGRDGMLLLGYFGLTQLPLLASRLSIRRWIRHAALVLFLTSAGISLYEGFLDREPEPTLKITRGAAVILEPIVFLFAGTTLVLRNREHFPERAAGVA